MQQRIVGAGIHLPEVSADEVVRAMKSRLFRAHAEEMLDMSLHGIYSAIVLDGRDTVRPLIVGGKKGSREPADAKIIRADGAFLHFGITLDASQHPVAVLAYNYEIVFPREKAPHFIRFDLNQPEHPNEEDGLRAHLHPGNDDLRAPAPVIRPLELLELFVSGLRARNPEKPRAAKGTAQAPP